MLSISQRRPARVARATAAALLVTVAVLPTVASAQARKEPVPQLRRTTPMVSMEASGLFSSAQGNALSDVGDGSGFDVMGAVGSGHFALGIGYQRTTHSPRGVLLSSASDATVRGFFLEPRAALPLAVGNFTPYVFGRAARLTRDGGALGSEDTQGRALGGGVGSYFWIARNIQINTSLLWQDLRFDQPATPLASWSTASRDGSQWAIRAGLSLGFDRWGR